MSENRYELNKNLAQMLKGGVIMDVTTPEQAKIAEAAGACAVTVLTPVSAASVRLDGSRPPCGYTPCTMSSRICR